MSTLLGPKIINEALVFVEQPALSQLVVLNSVKQDSPNTLWRIAEVLDRNQRT